MCKRQSHSLIVNILTFSRIPLIFGYSFLAVIAHFKESLPLAIVSLLLMAAAAFTDLFDGKLARKWDVVSTFGKLADPLMDKVFFIVAFPTLTWLIMASKNESAFHGCLMLAFTILYILRDQWVTFLRAVASSYKADVSAMWLGKLRTALSFCASGVIYIYIFTTPYLLKNNLTSTINCFAYVVYSIEIALILLNLYSCIVYTKAYWPYMKMAITSDGKTK
ncbi:MAG: CDP-alcohol phosphatidyltransferase family protein [Kiritimatiellae bacterium]|nr:CDP-alcohol phosphatidyltransferase family protein [Kiritimatiellia bacterium]